LSCERVTSPPPGDDQRLVVAHLDGGRLEADVAGVADREFAVSRKPAAPLTLPRQCDERLAVVRITQLVDVEQPLEGAAADAYLAAFHPADRARRTVQLQTHVLGRELRLLTEQAELLAQLEPGKRGALRAGHGTPPLLICESSAYWTFAQAGPSLCAWLALLKSVGMYCHFESARAFWRGQPPPTPKEIEVHEDDELLLRGAPRLFGIVAEPDDDTGAQIVAWGHELPDQAVLTWRLADGSSEVAVFASAEAALATAEQLYPARLLWVTPTVPVA
jgi:hypothetical protein